MVESPDFGLRTAVITVAHGRHGHLRNQQRALMLSATAPDDYIVVGMDDPQVSSWLPVDTVPTTVRNIESQGLGLPIAAARNHGAREAIERGAELLVFLDVDCIPDFGLVDGYRRAAERFAGRHVVWCGPVAYLPPPPDAGYDLDVIDVGTRPHPARPAPDPGDILIDSTGHLLFWSLSFATTTQSWQKIGGFDEAYVGYGAEDTDFGQRAAREHIDIGWVGGARAYHQYHSVSDPPIEHVRDIVQNANLFWSRWGFWPMTGWLDAFAALGLVELRGDGYVLLDDL